MLNSAHKTIEKKWTLANDVRNLEERQDVIESVKWILNSLWIDKEKAVSLNNMEDTKKLLERFIYIWNFLLENTDFYLDTDFIKKFKNSDSDIDIEAISLEVKEKCLEALRSK